MTEWEFLTEVVERADCGILFDVNNVYVSAMNHEFNPMDYVNAVPAHRVAQIHIAGTFKAYEKYILDTHDHPVIDPVWQLYARAIELLRPHTDAARMGTTIVPSFDEVRCGSEKGPALFLKPACDRPATVCGRMGSEMTTHWVDNPYPRTSRCPRGTPTEPNLWIESRPWISPRSSVRNGRRRDAAPDAGRGSPCARPRPTAARWPMSRPHSSRPIRGSPSFERPEIWHNGQYWYRSTREYWLEDFPRGQALSIGHAYVRRRSASL